MITMPPPQLPLSQLRRPKNPQRSVISGHTTRVVSTPFAPLSAQIVFVLETFRTGTMRVIHITVKTDETQILRIMFVLFYLNSNKNYHSICQQIDKSGNGSTSPPLD